MMTTEWLLDSVSQLPNREMEQLKEYLEFLVWKTKQQPIENSLAKKIIHTMEQSTDVTIEDAHSLLTTIEEAQKPVSPFPVSQLEPPDTPSVYQGAPLTLEEMDKAIDIEAGKQK